MKLRSLAFAALTAVWLGQAAQAQAPEPIPAPTEPPVAVPGTPRAEADEEEKENPVVHPLIEFHGEPVESALRALARQALINVVMSDKVAERGGTVTMRIENKTPQEAIEIICASKDFQLDELNGVFFIRMPDELAKESMERQLERQRKAILGPLAQFKGEYYRKLVEAGVPAATASDIVLREEVSMKIIEPQLHVGVKAQVRKKEESMGLADDRSLLPPSALKRFAVSLVFMLHFALAMGVWISAGRVKKEGEPLQLFPPFLWAGATLIGGVFVAALYWLMHDSSLRRSPAA